MVRSIRRWTAWSRISGDRRWVKVVMNHIRMFLGVSTKWPRSDTTSAILGSPRLAGGQEFAKLANDNTKDNFDEND